MKKPIYYFDLHENIKRVDKYDKFSNLISRLFSAKIIIPRSLCLYQRVPCKGIPRYHLSKFAKLKAQTISPFQRTESFALKNGDFIHLWIWNKEVEKNINLDEYKINRYEIFPSSLATLPLEDGVIEVKNPSGYELQLWKNNALLDSVWFNDTPSITQWHEYLKSSSEMKDKGWPEDLSEIKKSEIKYTTVYGKNLTPNHEAKIVIEWPKLVNNIFLLTSTLLISWGAYIYSQKESASSFIEEGLKSRNNEIKQIEPLIESRENANKTRQWLNKIEKLSPNPTIGYIIKDLSIYWPRQGIVFRELEIDPPTIQATLTSITSSPVRFSSILEQIEANNIYYDARFIDISAGSGFKFSWRINNNPKQEYEQ